MDLCIQDLIDACKNNHEHQFAGIVETLARTWHPGNQPALDHLATCGVAGRWIRALVLKMAEGMVTFDQATHILTNYALLLQCKPRGCATLVVDDRKMPSQLSCRVLKITLVGCNKHSNTNIEKIKSFASQAVGHDEKFIKEAYKRVQDGKGMVAMLTFRRGTDVVRPFLEGLNGAGDAKRAAVRRRLDATSVICEQGTARPCRLLTCCWRMDRCMFWHPEDGVIARNRIMT